MCKISVDAAKAMINGELFERSNTKVSKCKNWMQLYLYGHRIAAYNLRSKKGIYCTCGYNTATTRDRLNALPGLYVSMAGGTCTALEAVNWKLSKNPYYAQHKI